MLLSYVYGGLPPEREIGLLTKACDLNQRGPQLPGAGAESGILLRVSLDQFIAAAEQVRAQIEEILEFKRIQKVASVASEFQSHEHQDEHRHKHLRSHFAPSDKYVKPVITSHDYGWFTPAKVEQGTKRPPRSTRNNSNSNSSGSNNTECVFHTRAVLAEAWPWLDSPAGANNDGTHLSFAAVCDGWMLPRSLLCSPVQSIASRTSRALRRCSRQNSISFQIEKARLLSSSVALPSLAPLSPIASAFVLPHLPPLLLHTFLIASTSIFGLVERALQHMTTSIVVTCTCTCIFEAGACERSKTRDGEFEEDQNFFFASAYMWCKSRVWSKSIVIASARRWQDTN